MIKDLIEVQKNLPPVKKTASGNYGKHLDLEEIMPKVLDVLGKNNFAFVQAPTTQDNKPALRTTLYHTSGESITDTMLLVLDKTTLQGQGSGITYGRRYALCSMLGIVADKDDDGQKAEDDTAKAKAVSAGQVVEDLPSQSQIDLAKKLMNERGYDGRASLELCKKLIGKPLPKTKKEYSELIDKLLKEPNKPKAKPAANETPTEDSSVDLDAPIDIDAALGETK